MRLFTAIPLPYEPRRNLELLLAHLRPSASVRWSPVENLHITTKFIGEWPAERLEQVSDCLRNVPRRGAIPISIRGLGWFPNPHNPRIFWAAIEAPATLTELARDTEQKLSVLDITIEQRPFSPHLTLARIKTPVPLAALRQAVAALPSVDFGAFTADRFHLYESRPGPQGSIYTSLEEFPL